MDDIGPLIRSIRRAHGIPIHELAQRMGISWCKLQRLESGESPDNLDRILRAARALGLRPFMLLMSDSERRRAKLIFG